MGCGSRVQQWWDEARRLPRGGVVSLAAGFVLHLSLGGLYTFGNLTTYLTSYLHVRTGLDVDYGDTTWVSTTQSFIEGPGVFLGSLICQRFGARVAIILGSLLCSGGMALTGLAIQTSFAVTVLAFGVMCGFGIGLAYTSPMLMGYLWFPYNRGLVSGVVVGGYGLGSIIFTSVQTGYLNPDNVSPEDDGYFHDDDLLDRVPSLFFIQAAICVGLQVVGILGVHPPPTGYAAEALTEEAEETDVKSPTGDSSGGDDTNVQEKSVAGEKAAKEDPKAWRKYILTVKTLQLWLAYAMTAYGMIIVNSFWKAFGQTFIKDDHFLAMVGLSSSVFNFMGRVFWGFTCDMLGYKPTILMIGGLVAALEFTFPLTSLAGKGMLLVWMWAFFFSVSGTFSVVVTGTAATYGSQYAGHIYGVIFLMGALFTPLISIVSEAVLDRWDYPEAFLVGGGLVSIGVVATLTYQPPRKDGEDQLPAVQGDQDDVTPV